MRRFADKIALALLLFGLARPVHADCAIIDQLDKLHSLQHRLANNPQTGLFASDIRQLRAISSDVATRDAINAVDGNALMGKGADVARFLQETQNLLQGASMDDPLSVLPHFTTSRRANLLRIGRHLVDLRCTDEQITIAEAEAAENPIRATSDAEDMQQVGAAINRIAAEVFRPRSFFILIAVIGTSTVLARIIQRWLTLRRRRARRHPTTYNTRYTWDGKTTTGMLLDLNCLGAKLRHEKGHPIPQGTAVSLTIEDGSVDGTVMWGNTHYSGVRFRHNITLEQLAAILAAGDPDRKAAQTQNGAPWDAVS